MKEELVRKSWSLIFANKIAGFRAGLIHDHDPARQGVEATI